MLILLGMSLSIQLTALAVLSASVPVIAREPAVSVRARAAMEARASVGTATSVTRAAVQRDLPFSQTGSMRNLVQKLLTCTCMFKYVELTFLRIYSVMQFSLLALLYINICIVLL